MTPFSTQLTVSSAGTEVKYTGNADPGRGFYRIHAMSANTGKMYVGNVSEAVSPTTGSELTTDKELIVHLNRLSELWVDATVSGEKVDVLYLGYG